MSDKDKDNPFGSTPSQNPFGSPPSENPFGSPPSDDPFAAPPPIGTPQRADGAIPALVLGIIGIVFCPLCAPFAWVLGRQAEQKVDASGGMLMGRGEATAGKILGMVSCILSIVAIVVFISLIAVGSGVSTSP